MTQLVLDASVLLKWFAKDEERGSAEARELRRTYEAGRLDVVVPSLIFAELLNVAGRRWGWDARALVAMAEVLDVMDLDVGEPELDRIATWTARGLTAYDALYVSLAEERGIPLVTDDELVLSTAPAVARPLIATGTR